MIRSGDIQTILQDIPRLNAKTVPRYSIPEEILAKTALHIFKLDPLPFSMYL